MDTKVEQELFGVRADDTDFLDRLSSYGELRITGTKSGRVSGKKPSETAKPNENSNVSGALREQQEDV